MKIAVHSVLLVLSVVALTGAALPQTRWAPYANARFGYSIEYPSSLLKMQPPPANDDGRTFLSADGKTELRVWAGFNALNQTLKQKYDADLAASGAEITYKTLLKDGFAFSGLAGDDIIYQKTLHRRDQGGLFYTFTIRYPQSDAKRYDPIVRRLVATFRYHPKANV